MRRKKSGRAEHGWDGASSPCVLGEIWGRERYLWGQWESYRWGAFLTSLRHSSVVRMAVDRGSLILER